MKLKEFKEIINSIPVEYNNVNISLICNNREYSIEDLDNIEWYEDDIHNDEKRIDITLRDKNIGIDTQE